MLSFKEAEGRKIPYSERYQDAYSSWSDPIGEAKTVFVEGCRLPFGSEQIVIGELGFGAGLNFLTTWKAWKQAGSRGRLHYLSCEAFPLSRIELVEVLKLYPGFETLAKDLVEHYPVKGSGSSALGFRRIGFEEGKVVLTLLLGDARQMLSQIEGMAFDAWYLDGFAPKKNRELWEPALFQELARLSAPGRTRFSTYSAASQVRRDLEDAGFEVEKLPGFGKRERLQGVFRRSNRNADRSLGRPWFQLPRMHEKPKTAIVIGAGLAGASVANRLACRGLQVEVLERGQIAGEASGNRAVVAMPVLTASPEPLSRFYFAALDCLREILPKNGSAPLGVRQLVTGERTRKKVRKAFEDPYFDLGKVRENDGEVLFSEGSCFDPRQLCERWLGHSGVKVHTRAEARRVEKNLGGGWSVETNWKTYRADVVILANSLAARKMDPLGWLPLSSIRGQVVELPTHSGLSGLSEVLSFDAFLTPAIGGVHLLGSTYQRGDSDPENRFSDVTELLEKLATVNPEFVSPDWEVSKLKSRTAFRSVTPDSLPMIGPVPDRDHFLDAYSDLRFGRQKNYRPAKHEGGLYLSVGHGSRGVLSGPLGAEVLASQICGEPLPLEKDLVDALNPARFLVRRLVKNLD